MERVGIRTTIEPAQHPNGFKPFRVVLEVNTMADALDLQEALGKLHTPFNFGGGQGDWPCNVVEAEVRKQENRR